MLTKCSLTVTGTLKGYDQLMNLVLDNVEEVTRGMHFFSLIHFDSSSAANTSIHQTKKQTPPPVPSASSSLAAPSSSSSPRSTAAKKSKTPSCKPKTTSKSSDYHQNDHENCRNDLYELHDQSDSQPVAATATLRTGAAASRPKSLVSSQGWYAAFRC